jgi:Protein of unknown function (DUF998)
MLSTPKNREIDHRTLKLLVGLMALSLPFFTSLLAKNPITSISASYYEGGWSQSIFIGFLFAISAFLLAYNGKSTPEMVLSKVAAGASFGVALFPCDCEGHVPPVPYVHGVSAAIMFLILACFCYIFLQRARRKNYRQAQRRAIIYILCGITIVVSVLALGIDIFAGGIFSAIVARFTLYAEAAVLIAFGISWLTASRLIPFITTKEERDEYFDPKAVQDVPDGKSASTASV